MTIWNNDVCEPTLRCPHLCTATVPTYWQCYCKAKVDFYAFEKTAIHTYIDRMQQSHGFTYIPM
jgi:hypothetical protein